MAWNSYSSGPHQVPFWEFVHALDPNHPSYAGAGAGVDHTTQGPQPGAGFATPFGAGFPFGGSAGGPHHWRGGWGRHAFRRGGLGGRGGCRGRHCARRRPTDPNPEDPPTGDERDVNMNEPTTDNEKEGSPATMRDEKDETGANPQPPNPAIGDGPGFPHHPHPHHHPHHRHHHGPPPPPPPYGAGPSHPFDFRAMMAAFAAHPYAQQVREYVQNARSAAAAARGAASGDNTNNNDYGDEVFVPPVDVFTSETAWTVHVALPGARKEDVGVNWDAERSHLAVSGVVYRPGNEEFLRGLVDGERKVGMFERNVRLPPVGAAADGAAEKDEVDAEGITARMEDGLLIVVVPKVERDWTEVRKVDIE